GRVGSGGGGHEGNAIRRSGPGSAGILVLPRARRWTFLGSAPRTPCAVAGSVRDAAWSRQRPWSHARAEPPRPTGPTAHSDMHAAPGEVVSPYDGSVAQLRAGRPAPAAVYPAVHAEPVQPVLAAAATAVRAGAAAADAAHQPGQIVG